MHTPPRLALLVLVVTSSWAPAAAAGGGGALTVNGANSPFRIDVDDLYDSVTVASGGLLLVNARLDVTGDMIVQSGGVVSHDAEDPDLHIVVGGALNVQLGGSVDVTGKGFRAGGNVGGFANEGETLDPLTFATIPGSGPGNGGSHGGAGGRAVLSGNAPPAGFGAQVDPLTFGGGGGIGSCGARAGHGGGKLTLEAASVRIDGAVRADGESSPPGNCGNAGGGGAGGSVRILTPGLWQGGGTVSAAGGTGHGGGGGGRVYVQFGSKTFSGTVSALPAGTGVTVAGGAGSVYLIDGDDGALVAQGGTLALDGSTTHPTLTLLPASTVFIRGLVSITAQPVTVAAGSTLVLDTSDALQGLSLTNPIAGTLRLNAPLTLPTTTVAGLLLVNEPLIVDGNLTVNANAVVSHDAADAGFALDVTGTLDVRLNGAIDTSAKGLLPGPVAGFGQSGAALSPQTLLVVSGSGTLSGGSHGGAGGNVAQSGAPFANPVYGDADAPLLVGAGGGAGTCGSRGGDGGGAVRIDAPLVIVNGAIRADGVAAAPGGCGPGGGGGGGGTIAITTAVLQGNGTISAKGGASSGGGGGGGGRVRIDVDDMPFTGTITAVGGVGGTDGLGGVGDGGPGSVSVLDAAEGALLVVGGARVLDADDSFESVELGPSATLELSGTASVTQPIDVAAGTTVVVSASDALDGGVALAPDVDGTIIIDADITVPDDMVLRGSLVINRRLQVASLRMLPGALVTHDAFLASFDLFVSGVLDVDAGASFDADFLGLLAAPAAGFGNRGATLDPFTLAVVAGSDHQNGGSHASLGGQANVANALAPAFDDPLAPALPGGGGSAGTCSSRGGRGGGVLRIAAGALVLDGLISVDGENAAGGGCGVGGGGGAGGTVVLALGSFAGGGQLFARGGDSDRGGGAGGAVVISSASDTFAGAIDVGGGSGFAPGASGSLNETVASEPPAFVSTPLLDVQTGVLYRYRAIASGSPVLGFSLVTGPSGMSIDATSGEVLWPSPVAGSHPVTIRVENGVGADEQSFTLVPTDAPLITSIANTSATVDVAYLYDGDATASANGTPPITWSRTTGPAEFVIDGDSGVVTWTPAAAGTVPICIRATNAFGSNQQCFQVVVAPPPGAGGVPPTITSVASTVGFVNVPYEYDADATVEATGDAPLVFSALLAPVGFGIDPASGVVSWTPSPAQAGASAVCIAVSNDAGDDTQCFTVDVAAEGAPVFTSTPIELATEGVPYAYDVDGAASATGPGPITFSAPTAPPGFTIDPVSGAVTWTPGAEDVGDVDIVLRAENSVGFTEQPFTVTVLPAGAGAAPVIVRSANSSAAVGVPYQFDSDGIVEAGGDAPITWSVIDGPSSFHVDATTGLVSWLPEAAGAVTLTVRAANAIGSDSYGFVVDVVEDAGPEPTPVAVVTPLTGDAPLTVSADGSGSFAPPGATVTFYRWTFGDGSAPVDAPLASHTYERAGSYVARLRVADAVGTAGEAGVVVSVAQDGVLPPAARVLVSQVDGSDALSVSFSCDCRDGSAPIEAFLWDFGDGSTSDVSTVSHEFGPGGFEVRLTVVDANGLTAVDSVQIRVADGENLPPLAAASALPAFGAAPLDVAFLVTAGDLDGDVASIAWDFGDGSGGAVDDVAPRYSYANAGTYLATVTVTDDDGLATHASVEIDVANAAGRRPPQVLSLPILEASVGVAYSYDEDGLPAARGDRPLTWTLGKSVGGTIVGAPAGMLVDAQTGRVAWTPSAAQIGRVPVSLVASNDAGAVAQDFEIVVDGEAPPPPPAAQGCGCDASSSSSGASAGSALLGLACTLLQRRRRRVCADVA